MNTDRFKFRCWDEVINQYRKEGTIQLSGNGQPFIINGDMQVEDIEDVIIEQCTGLKDRNGKLIYEKDIVRFYWTEQDPQEFVVRWNNVRSCIDFNMYKNGKRGCKFDRWWECFASGKCDFAEVIGNIHDDQFRDITKLVDGKDGE